MHSSRWGKAGGGTHGPTLLPLTTNTAYSCFIGSQPSAQLPGPLRPCAFMRIACGFPKTGGGGAVGQHSAGLLHTRHMGSAPPHTHTHTVRTHLARSVGPRASDAKLLGKSGLPGPRSPTASYGISLLLTEVA